MTIDKYVWSLYCTSFIFSGVVKFLYLRLKINFFGNEFGDWIKIRRLQFTQIFNPLSTFDEWDSSSVYLDKVTADESDSSSEFEK